MIFIEDDAICGNGSRTISSIFCTFSSACSFHDCSIVFFDKVMANGSYVCSVVESRYEALYFFCIDCVFVSKKDMIICLPSGEKSTSAVLKSRESGNADLSANNLRGLKMDNVFL